MMPRELTLMNLNEDGDPVVTSCAANLRKSLTGATWWDPKEERA